MIDPRTQILFDAIAELGLDLDLSPGSGKDREAIDPYEQAMSTLNKLKQGSSRWRANHEKMDQKLNELVDAMVAFASLDFFHRAPVGNEGDLFDALATGLNALGEELHSSTVSRSFLHGIISSMLDTLLVIDKNGRIKMANQALLNLLGYQEEEVLEQPISMIFAEEALEQINLDHVFMGQPFLYYETFYQSRQGKKIPVSFSTSMLQQEHSKENDIVCVAQDITERKRQEEKLKASLEEKVVLLKEVHHRVKNNMQIISSLLYLQAEYITDKYILGLFQESQNRIHAMALVHEQLYKSRDLARIDFAEYVESLAIHVWRSHGRSQIQQHIDISPISLTVELAIPCGLILNELVSNAMKHAFPNEQGGEVMITLRRQEGTHNIILCVEDNGVGLPSESILKQTQSLGLTLVDTLTRQLRGTVEFKRENGTKAILTFPFQEESPGQKRITP